MKTRMQGWLARVALSLVAIAAWGTGATAQSLSGVYGGEKCPYRLTFRGKDVVYIQFLEGYGGAVAAEMPGQYKVDGDKVPVTATAWSTVFTRKGDTLETPEREACTKWPVRRAGAPTARVQPDSGEAAYVAAMKDDLRILVMAEEDFFAHSFKYTSLIGPGGLQFDPGARQPGARQRARKAQRRGAARADLKTGNSVPVISLTADGWRAVIGNAHTRTTCAIYVGSTPMAPATKEGDPACQ